MVERETEKGERRGEKRREEERRKGGDPANLGMSEILKKGKNEAQDLDNSVKRVNIASV